MWLRRDRHRLDEPTSFENFYRTNHAPMVRLAYLLTGSRVIAEDLVQDSFYGEPRRARSTFRRRTSGGR